MLFNESIWFVFNIKLCEHYHVRTNEYMFRKETQYELDLLFIYIKQIMYCSNLRNQLQLSLKLKQIQI